MFTRIDSAGTARFLTFSCYRRLQLLGTPALRDHFIAAMRLAFERHAVHPLAWIVMPEHVHLIVLPERNEAVTSFLMGLKRPFAQLVLKRWRELRAPVLSKLLRNDGTHRYWQTGGGFDRLLHGNELFEKIRYCHQNPIRRGLSVTSIDWRWSSAPQYEGLVDSIGPRVAFHVMPPADRVLT